MRRQLRPFHSEYDQRALYARPYDHTRWPEHVLRVKHTTAILRAMKPRSVADLSCGDGCVTRNARLRCPAYLGDLTGNWEYRGAAEETIFLIPDVDVFVCSETLEHVRDPDLLLRLIRGRAGRLLLTTPDSEAHDDNPEHYWSWDEEGLGAMLAAAGWENTACEKYLPPVERPHYAYQVWRCG